MNLLHDSTKKLFIQYLIPSISGALAVTLYSLVDAIAIGQSAGPNGSAACAVLVPITALATFIGIFCGIGGSVLMSRAKGESNEGKRNAYFTTSLILLAIITIAVWVSAVIFRIPLYRFLGTSDVLMPYVADYGNLMLYVFPVFAFMPYLACILRNDDNPNLAMVGTLAGTLVNIFGDWFFVFPMDMGMFGASLATALGSFVQVIIMLAHFISKKRTLKADMPFQPFTAIAKICANGFGASFSQIAIIITTLIVNNQIMRYAGEAELAVYGMLIVLSQLFVNIFTGIGQAAQPIISTNFGAQKHDRCYQVYGLGLQTVLLFGLLFTVVCELIPVPVSMVFMKITPQVQNIVGGITRLYAFSFLPAGIAIYFTLYYQSVMKSKMATGISLLRGLLFSTLLLYILPLFMGCDGIWWAIVATEILTVLFILACQSLTKKPAKPEVYVSGKPVTNIITVSREFGSGGRELGKRLAQQLNFAYYDTEIIAEIAKETNLNEDYISSMLKKGANSFTLHFGRTFSTQYNQIAVEVLTAQHNIIKKIADQGNCVIVGRGADVLLANREPLKLFIYADTKAKIKRCREKGTEDSHLSDKELTDRFHQIDNSRKKLHEQLSPSTWGDSHCYHLCNNTSNLVIKDMIPAVADFANQWFKQ